MKRFQRPILLGMVLFFLLLTGLGGWFYYHYFVSTGSITKHAEKFLFRRMTVAQLADKGTYRFLYITNRNSGETNAALDIRYGSDREETLKFGIFDAKIEPSLGLGMIINPTQWFQNEEIQLTNVQQLENAAFIEKARKLVKKSPDHSLLVVIHGFRETFPTALRKTAFLGHVLDVNSPVLLFDWPGNQGRLLSGYRKARQVAEASGAELAAALMLIIKEISPERLWLVANSMGGQVVADAFELLCRDSDLADAETEIEDVVLTAPDVDHDEFDERFKQEIQSLTRNLTVYVSSNDRALLLSRLINQGRRKGESTLSPDQLEEAIRILNLVEPESEQIALVDVTPVNRTRNFHNFSLETPEFFDDLYMRLTNTTTPNSRLIYQIKTPEGKGYWVLTKGR